jgi:transcriptional regulator with XRE-family HTH domain
VSGRNSASLRLPDEAWRNSHMLRAWRTRDFRAVFFLACRFGLAPDVIAANAGLPPDLVVDVMRDNAKLDDAALVESMASGLGMPDDVRSVVGLAPCVSIPAPVPVPQPRAAKSDRLAGVESREPVGVRIAMLRRARGLTQELLAERAGVSLESVRKVEQQTRTPSLAMLDALANALDIPAGELIAPSAPKEQVGGKRQRAPDYLPAEIINRPDFAAACAGRDLGAIFTIAVSAGFTASHLARRCEMTPSHVSDYMAGRRTAKDIRIFERVSEGLRIPGLMLGIGNRPADHEEGNETAETVSQVVLFDQLELLRQEMNEALSQGAMAEASLDDWERTVIRYGRATRDRPASVLIADVGTDLADLKRALNHYRSASALRRLTRVAAQMSGLMCLLFCILDDRPAFRRWARTARLAGEEAGDPETLCWILAQEAHGHYYSGDILEAIDVARHAYGIVRTPCVGAALAAALEARAYAVMGQYPETREALARAETFLSHLNGNALTPSAFGYHEASFRFHEGNAYTHLRDVESAFRAQDRALALCARQDYTDWALTRLDRAHCLTLAGDITEGLKYATETMASLTGPQRQGIISLRGHNIINALPERGKSLAVARDFRELLMLPAGTSEG